MIALLGANGSMGRRYRAILRFLGVPFVCFDVDTSWPEIMKVGKTCEGSIIATPTALHLSHIAMMAQLKKPILCEKPLTNNVAELDDMFSLAPQLRMQMQYLMLDDPKGNGSTHYDYYNTGKDGLIWDCFQPIAIARGECEVKNESPIWSCRLNGKYLSLSDMDAAYVNYVKLWLKEPAQDAGFLREAHHKVAQIARKYDAANNYRHSG